MSTYRPPRMKFGIFLGPFHRLEENPTVAFERDLELLELLERLDFDEAWIGEHHSAGWEIIASPELFIVAAAERTKKLRLASGVLSLPYQHPLIVADRFVQLDHMTRGRAILGIGPGALSSDAYMLGINPLDQRRMMNESLDVIMRLFRGEVVTMETDWFRLHEARLQIAPYTHPHPPMAVAAAGSPAGAQAAGRHGIDMVSFAGLSEASGQALSRTWGWYEEAAAEAGHTVSREQWRLGVPFYLADSREQAIAEAREGYERELVEYFGGTISSATQPDAATIEAGIEQGGAIVGTPDDAIAGIERLLEMTGGFGGFLARAHEWGTWEQTVRSYELFSRYVIPHFRGQLEAKRSSQQFVADTPDAKISRAAVEKAFSDAGIDVTSPEEQAAARRR
ncbi:MAG: LLM class flavin-dependent oxidoreductase [Dehalococcoidia bacterium]|nr:LLM class flavin-dependent oxidoreductase [Dehalococcoidia bacterium]